MKKFLLNRPAWFRHEGYWRIAQVFRLGPAGLLIAAGIAGEIAGVYIREGNDIFVVSAGYICGGVGLFAGVHLLLRLACWIADGFQAAGQQR